mgnify:FL=1
MRAMHKLTHCPGTSPFDPTVRLHLATYCWDAAPLQVLERDHSPSVGMALSGNPSTPMATLMRLCESRFPDVQSQAIRAKYRRLGL